jgi:opacity protein-like surface antigen
LRQILGLALFLLAFPSLSAAQTSAEPLNFELTPFAGYRFGGEFDVADSDTTLNLNDSPSFGLLFNIRQHANTQWEILYSQQKTDTTATGSAANGAAVDVDIHILQGGGTYQGDGDTFMPYLAATIGGTHIKVHSGSSQSDTFWSGSIGLGLQIRPTERIGLRLEARGYGTLTSSSTDLFCQTGPEQNVCAIRIDGTVLWQLETFAGIVVRF